jgi:hypothetical protein
MEFKRPGGLEPGAWKTGMVLAFMVAELGRHP